MGEYLIYQQVPEQVLYAKTSELFEEHLNAELAKLPKSFDGNLVNLSPLKKRHGNHHWHHVKSNNSHINFIFLPKSLDG